VSALSLTRRILVVFAHPYPNKSRVNRALRDAVLDLPGVRVRDLYETYPDFSIDVPREQELLLEADVIVLQHPFYWYSCPPLLKEWIDCVLESGWAYGAGGTKLHGKFWLQALSTGGTPDDYSRRGYNHFSVKELLRPFEQTAYLCGMRPLEPFVVPGSRKIADSDIERKAFEYRNLVVGLRDGAEPTSYSTRLANGAQT